MQANETKRRKLNRGWTDRDDRVDAWEENRMLTSGVAQRKTFESFSAGEDDEETTRLHLLVHDIKPPFLDGQKVFTNIESVSPVQDPNSDMAKIARKGSRVVKEKRQQRERQKQAKDVTSIANTTLGNLMGVKEDDDDSAPLAAEEQYRGSYKFAEHIKANEGPSAASQNLLQEQRESLPAFAVREDLLRVIRDNQVVVVIGETGSGKTTQLSQFLFEDGISQQGLIGCTQPRRIAAMSVAKRVSEEMQTTLGGLVGYAIRFEDRTSADTRIKYMTDGVLLRETLVDPNLDKYSCLIIDEAHERSLNSDLLLGLLKKVLTRRRDLKLIVTSATMNSRKYCEFFHAVEFTIPGRTFPVEISYSSITIEDFVDASANEAIKVHVSQPPGDILVFLPGQMEIGVCCELIQERLQMLYEPPKLSILPIYSQMPVEAQAKIFEKASGRRVIVATNIAETSLTIDGIVYVIDSGYSKLKVYHPNIGLDVLQVNPISQANAMQRAGRAGRTMAGKAFHLFTKRAFDDEMYLQTIPEIQRANLSNTLLLLKSLKVDDLLDFDWVDSPPKEAITTSLFELWALGCLDHSGELTSLGQQASSFPMDPSLSKMLIASAKEGCSEECIIIASMLSVPNVWIRPKERREECDSAREKFCVPESDFLTFLHVYGQWKAKGYSDHWCSQHFLNWRSLRKAKEIREQLADIMKAQRLPLISCGSDWDLVLKTMCSAYYPQAAKRKGPGQYTSLRTSMTMKLHPTSALYGLADQPEFVVYHELVLTSKEPFMSTVSTVDPRWLAAQGGVFYSVKEKGRHETEFSRKQEIETEIAEARQREEQRRAKLEGNQQETADRAAKANIKIISHGAVKRPVALRRRGLA